MASAMKTVSFPGRLLADRGTEDSYLIHRSDSFQGAQLRILGRSTTSVGSAGITPSTLCLRKSNIAVFTGL